MKADFKICLVLVGILLLTNCKKNDDGIDMIDTNETKIELTVSKIKTQTGQIQIGLYNSEENWEIDIKNREGGNEFIVEQIKVEDNKVKFDFEALEPGQYAFSIYHDENGNNILDKDDILGVLPQEPFGFSNNFVPEFGIPKFSDCSFEVVEYMTTIVEIDLVNN